MSSTEEFLNAFQASPADTDAQLAPMQSFLNSDEVIFSPMEYVPMNVFFKAFRTYCQKNNYHPPRYYKYSQLWHKYNIKCAKMNLLWDGKQKKQRYLRGIGLSEITDEIPSLPRPERR